MFYVLCRTVFNGMQMEFQPCCVFPYNDYIYKLKVNVELEENILMLESCDQKVYELEEEVRNMEDTVPITFSTMCDEFKRIVEPGKSLKDHSFEYNHSNEDLPSTSKCGKCEYNSEDEVDLKEHINFVHSLCATLFVICVILRQVMLRLSQSTDLTSTTINVLIVIFIHTIEIHLTCTYKRSILFSVIIATLCQRMKGSTIATHAEFI